VTNIGFLQSKLTKSAMHSLEFANGMMQPAEAASAESKVSDLNPSRA
jgi:hypothetical protein